MSKEYVFEFQGTKETFLEMLKQFSNNDNKFYYFDNYIVKLIDDEIHFGVERGGHSGGYWFIPTITEFNDRIEFRGTIQYIGPENNRSKPQKIFDNAGEILLFIILLPVILIFRLYMGIKWCIRKIFKQPKPKTTEDKLYDLMERYFGCVRM